MTIELSTELAAFVRERVEKGAYRTERDVVRAAFALLEERERILDEIDAGTRELESGAYVEYDEHSRQRFLDDLRAANPAT